MTKLSLWRTGVGILLLLFCYRLWGLGISNHDDAVWLIASHQGRWNIIKDFAIEQGRVWAWISGTLLYSFLYLQGTFVGETLKLGSLVVFFLFFYKMIAAYFGQLFALMAATLNMALFALCWDESITMNYPGIFWVLGSCFPCAVLAGQRYFYAGKPTYFYISLLLLFASFFSHEGVSILFMVLFPVSLWGNEYFANKNPSLQKFWQVPRNRRLTIGAGLVTFLYIGLYLGWRIPFPSTYEGTSFNQINVLRALPVLLSFAGRGSILSDFAFPFSVNYADAVNRDSYQVVYAPWSYIKGAAQDPMACLNALTVLLLVGSLFAAYKVQEGSRPNRERKELALAAAVGILIAILPILPVALMQKYQHWYYDLGVRAYSHTALSHFGVTIFLTALLLRFCPFYAKGPFAKNTVAWIVVGGVAAGALCGFRMNDAIANDMRVETSRWRAVDQAVAMAARADPNVATLYAPRLQNGSWFTVVDENYWAQYVATYDKKAFTFLHEAPLKIAETARQVAYMDYSLGPNGRQLLVWLAPLVKTKDNSIEADRVVVSIENPSPSDVRLVVVSFVDKKRGPITVRFGQLDALNKSGSIRVLIGVDAVPSSIRLERQSTINVTTPLLKD